MVPTDDNPADLPSRGCLAHELIENKLWPHGPEFLCDSSFSDYKVFERNLKNQPLEREDPERKKPMKTQENVLLSTNQTTEVTPNTNPKLHSIIDLGKFNDLAKLLCVTALVLRFISNIKSKTKIQGELQASEMKRAQQLWVISEQLRDEKSNPIESKKTKANLRTYLDDGVMRCRGRLGNSELPYDSKYPIYIPKRSRLAILIITEAHENVFHHKERPTMTEVRTNFWIPTCRKLVRSVIPKCKLCIRLESVALTLPPAPSLPAYRLEIASPFTNVGYDHMGPIWVYDIYGKEGIAHKAYISLVTCCTTRMVHLELQPSLEAPACIRGLERTFSRKPFPKRLISDNHKTFRSTAISKFAAANFIEWKYILELSPHWGGFYERLNRMIKSGLRKTLWKTKSTYEEVETIVIKIEGALNCRPLCYVDDSDLSEPITPAHLMYGSNIQQRPMHGGDPPPIDDKVKPGVRVKHVNKLQKQFWGRFIKEYVVGLRERDRKTKKQSSNNQRELKVGDVVMIFKKHIARSSWPLG